jgi:hypothetical protein
VEGQVAAQPLFVKDVDDGKTTKDLVIVATRKNFIYAFDANITDQNAPDNGIAWGPIQLTAGNRTLHAEPLKGMDDGPVDKRCLQTHGPVGITSTPVVDAASRLMYVVFRVAPRPRGEDFGNASYFLAEINVTNGQEVARTAIAADPPAATAHFDANAELNRPGLLLMKNPLTGTNVLSVAFGAPVCDSPRPFDGWVFAYSVPDLRLLDTYVTAPQTHGAGIWQSGSGLAGAAVGGAVYATTGNNTCPTTALGTACPNGGIAENQTGAGSTRDDRYHASRTDLGESILKLKLGADDKFVCLSHFNGFCVTDRFTAGNWFRLDTGYGSPSELQNPVVKTGGDSDLGSGGPVIFPNGWVIAGGKQGRMYILDPSHMHDAQQGFQFSFNTWHPLSGNPSCMTFHNTKNEADNPADHPNCSITENDYDFGQAYGPNIHGSPVVWDDADPGFGLIYTMAEKDFLRAYRFFDRGNAIRVEEHSYKTTEGNSQPHPRGLPNLRSPDGMPGAALSLSANGNRNAILWVSVSPCEATNDIRAGTLMAFDARDLRLLWFEDGTNPNWLCAPPQGVDLFTTPPVAFAKFVPPTIAGGKVFRATFGDHDTCPNQQNQSQWISCGSVIFYGLRTHRVEETPIGVHP